MYTNNIEIYLQLLRLLSVCLCKSVYVCACVCVHVRLCVCSVCVSVFTNASYSIFLSS